MPSPWHAGRLKGDYVAHECYSTSCSNHLSMAQASHCNRSTYGSVASFYRRWSNGGEVFPLNLKTMSLSGCQTTSSQSKWKPSGDVHSWSGSVQSGFYGTAVRNESTSLFFFFIGLHSLVAEFSLEGISSFRVSGPSVWSIYWERKREKKNQFITMFSI